MEECIICFEEYTDFVTFPCDHKVCVLCYPKLKRCPLCNITINEPSNTIEVNPMYQEPWYFDTRVRITCYLIILAIFLLSMSRFE
jgi:hypothetical protein